MIEFFEKVLGKENVSIDTNTLEIYSTDSSQILGTPKIICWPTDPKQIHQIILYSRRNKTTVSPRGAGTNLTGSIRSKDAIILDLSKMDKILDKGKETIIVEPGIRIGDLNKQIAPLYFPITPATNRMCTIGGMISTNASGPESIRFGRMKDWVQEIEMIDGSGRIKTLKNNFCGFEGQTGIIVSAKLKVLPEKPKYNSMNIFKFNTYETLIQKVIEIKNNPDIILLEVINHEAAKLANLNNTNYLIVVYTNEQGEIKDPKEIDEVIKLRNTIPDKLYLEGYKIEEDISIKHDNMVELLYWMDKNDIPVYGHIGIGGLHPVLRQRTKIKELFDEIQKLKGDISNEYGMGVLKKNYLPEPIKQELIMLKKKFDPFNILNVTQ